MDRLKHFCPEWDYYEISESDPEFKICTCYPKAPILVHESEYSLNDEYNQKRYVEGE